jgi:hypothetical protein
LPSFPENGFDASGAIAGFPSGNSGVNFSFAKTADSG